MACKCGLGRSRSKRSRGMSGVPWSFKSTILGDDPGWARRARDCLRNAFAQLRMPVTVTAVGNNVVVRTPKRKVSYTQAEAAMRRVEKTCGL